MNRRELVIPEEIRDLYENIFHTQSNREFLNFWDAGRVCQIEKDKLIILLLILYFLCSQITNNYE